jgi:hypothetical protein
MENILIKMMTGEFRGMSRRPGHVKISIRQNGPASDSGVRECIEFSVTAHTCILPDLRIARHVSETAVVHD